MKRLPLSLLLATAAAVVVCVVGSRMTGCREAAGQPLPSGEEALQYQGTSTCASANCHHGNGPQGAKGSEYTTWAIHDPHARAATVLADERSRRIVRNLKELKDGEAVHPEKEELCLRCHVLQDFTFAKTPRHERFAVSDGVGCEACHGPAEKWLDAHTRKDWPHEGPGFRPMKDLGVRAERCVACHVGRGDMDVDHDLIAAGHPRLRFEFGAYLAVYPSHWPEVKDRRGRPDFEARAWLLGQLVCAGSAMDLLAHRAGAAVKNQKPWPEFAEYECAACHHGLKADSDRQKRGYAGRPGALRWGTWYPALLPILSSKAQGGDDSIDGALKRLSQEMIKPLPDAKVVQREATLTGRQIRRRQADVEKAVKKAKGKPEGLNAEQVDKLLKALAKDDQQVRAGWDEATQIYLGLTALNQGLRDLRTHGRNPPGLQDALRALGKQLAEAFPKGGDSLYDTPGDFRPDRVAGQLKEIEKLLR